LGTTAAAYRLHFMEGRARISVLIDLASTDPIRLPSGWTVRRLGPQRAWPKTPTRIVIELERKPLLQTSQIETGSV
jgi:hypothetical protein